MKARLGGYLFAFIRGLFWSMGVIAAATAAVLAFGFVADFTAERRPVIITNSPGGGVDEFLDRYADYRLANRKIVVDGICLSACTFLIPSIEPSNLCMTSRSIFGFHSARYFYEDGRPPRFAKEETRIIWNFYPQALRDILSQMGWDGDGDKPQIDFVYLDQEMLAGIVRPCEQSELPYGKNKS